MSRPDASEATSDDSSAGLGTVFPVLRRQTALVTAQAQELRARADLNQALAFLDRAVGGTLESHGVTLEPAGGSGERQR